jgi:putative nucleotidyltransferase with HDIG domain
MTAGLQGRKVATGKCFSPVAFVLPEQSVEKIFWGDSVGSMAHVVGALYRMLEARLKVVWLHSGRVASLAALLADWLGMGEEEQKIIYTAGLLHDIGKMGVPGGILFKPGRLTGEEWEEMKNHPVYSFNVLSPIPEMGTVSRLVLYHHERYDGRGYPAGLKGEEIPLGARILAVADSYDAMTSHRVYRPAKSGSEALQELYRCAGTRFDPRVVEVFCRQAARDGVECSLRQPDLRALTITLSPEKAGSKGRDLKG